MERSNQTAIPGRPLIFGEVLFDCFPDGQEVMGGAPFNVAWHLQGFGVDPLFISRVGRDERGAHVQDAMRDWGMELAALQTDAVHPTGRVQLTFTDTVHSFDILADQAYDFIASAPAIAAARQVRPALLYHGSLITRGAAGRETLAALQTTIEVPLFVDINLRAPWWNADGVRALMRGARWVKLNEDELAALRGAACAEDDIGEARKLASEYGIERVILTRGEQGASYVGTDVVSGTPPPVPVLADTIGAGDAFSAVTILGLLHGWEPALTLERALAFAARICSQRGATAPDRALYRELRETWGV